MANRRHPRIEKLPQEVRREIENKLLDGYTYTQIVDYLKGMGHDVSRSAVGRFGKPFLERFESVRMAKEFAQLLAEDNAERPSTEVHEANNALASQMMMELLIDDNIEVETKLKTLKDIAALQRAQVTNEKLKLEARREAGAVHTALKSLKAQVYDELGQKHPDIAKKIIKLAEDVEKQAQQLKGPV